jgi:hypothetical protein
VEILAREFRSQPVTDERRLAIAPMVEPSADVSMTRHLPSGAAATACLLKAHWPPERELIDDLRKLGDCLVRELVWPAANADYRDWLTVSRAIDQAVEISVLLAAVASATLRRPEVDRAEPRTDVSEQSPAARADSAFEPTGVQQEAADAWLWISRLMLTACELPDDPGRRRDVNVEQWEILRFSLSGVSASILAALSCIHQRQADVLDQRLEVLLDAFCTLGESILSKPDPALETDPVIQYLRMIGLWLFETKYAQRANRIAQIVSKAKEPPRHLIDMGYWEARYPGDGFHAGWRPPIISPIGQIAVPQYLQFVNTVSAADRRDSFEHLIDRLRQPRRT